MSKEDQITRSLTDRVFQPVLSSHQASKEIKNDVRYTIIRFKERDAAGIVAYASRSTYKI